MAGRHGIRSTKKPSKSTTSIQQTSTKKRKEETASASASPKDWNILVDECHHHKEIQPQLKVGASNDNHTNGWIFDSESDHDVQPVGLWKGNAVGQAAKEMLQAVEHRYPTTFTSQGVTIRSSRYWLSTLKELHVFIKAFLETPVGALAKEQITSLEADLNDFERFGFDLSWARNRLHMVNNLKFGTDPLGMELLLLEESLKMTHAELMEANARFDKARFDYDSARDARNNKAEEVAQKFGAEYDEVLNGNLGLGMLPGY